MSHTIEKSASPAEDAARHPTPAQAPRVSHPRLAGAAAGLLGLGYALLFGWLSLERYWSYQMHALDMGNMAQAAWNTVHGHPFFYTDMRLLYGNIEAWGTTTRLSFHVEALFPPISLVYLIYAHPESLLVLQTVALALGAIPDFQLARDILRNAWLALVFVFLYVLFPSLEGLNLYEFHAVSLATPLLLFAFLFLYRRQWAPFVICCLLAMGTKEEIGLVVAMFGLYAAFWQRERLAGFGMAVIGVFWSLFAVLVIEKHYRTPGSLSYAHSRYGYLGHGVSGALHTILHNPGAIGRVVFIWPKFDFLERLLAPVGYTPLLAPWALLLGLPTFALNLLSNSPSMYSALGADDAELIAVSMIAGILGAALLLRLLYRWMRPRWAAVLVVLYLIAQALWSQRASGFTPIGSAWQMPSVGAHQRLENRFVSMIPASAPVSTQDQLEPHLASRHYVYLFQDTGRQPPRDVPPANYVLLDAGATTYPLPSWQLYDYAQGLLHHGWGIRRASDGLILIEKGVRRSSPPPAFYSYTRITTAHTPTHRVDTVYGHVTVTGYDVSQTDLPNHDIPNLNYTVYLRPWARVRKDVQPVLYETVGHRLINCVDNDLGLSWLPASRWQRDQTYAVHMDKMETVWNVPGTVQLWIGMSPAIHSQSTTCAHLWAANRTPVTPAGTLTVQY